MAQGCHLIYSHSDRDHFPLNTEIKKPNVEKIVEQFKSTFNLKWSKKPSQRIVKNESSGIKLDEIKATSTYGISKGTIKTFKKRFEKLDPRQQAMVAALLAAKSDRQSDIITGLGNYNLNDMMARKIPEALAHLLKRDKNISGLFNQVRKGESAWISNLKNTGKGKADGIAYEVLASARMLNFPLNGRPISHGDRLDFGIKLQASYAGGGNLNVTDGVSKSIFAQPYRKTVEADLLITQPPSPMGGGKEIAVDFKHSIGTATISEEQLKGVAVALKTGEVDEWHFVSNTNFSGSVQTKITEINKELISENKPIIQLHQNYDWR